MYDFRLILNDTEKNTPVVALKPKFWGPKSSMPPSALTLEIN